MSIVQPEYSDEQEGDFIVVTAKLGNTVLHREREYGRTTRAKRIAYRNCRQRVKYLLDQARP